MIVFGGLDDQLVSLVWSKLSSGFLFLPDSFSFYADKFWFYLHPCKTSQPIFTFLLSVFGTLLSSYSIPLVVVVSFLLSFFVAYLFFKFFGYPVFYALIFALSSYAHVHLGIHLYLSQIWLYPLFLIQLRKLRVSNHKLKEVLILSFLMAFSISISNYIGFFILIYFSLYSLLKFLFTKNLIYIKNFFLVSIFSGVLSLLFLFPYIKANYFSATSTVSSEISYISQDPLRTLQRPHEDFFHFSSRPWYFFLPPVKNPWLGDFSQNLISKLKATNYFLADDYFAGEHSANYFGLAFLASVTVFSIIMIFKAPAEKKKQIAFYWVLNFVLYLFMMPPFFTIWGIKFFTPGELMFRFFPMFRVTTRMAPLLLLNFLIISGISVDYLSKKHTLFFKIFVPILIIVTLLETFVSPKIVILNAPPNVYTYIGENHPQTRFLVYPNSRNHEAFFWIDAHKSYLLSVKANAGVGLDMDKLSDILNTNEGLSFLTNISAKYIVVFKDSLDKDKLFFLNSPELIMEKEFEDSYLFKANQ